MVEQNDWSAAEQKIQHIVTTSPEPFERDTISQAGELFLCLRGGYALPEVGRGYWPTICFSWDTKPPIQVEIFATRYEFYRLDDGCPPDIRHFEHTLGEPIPPDLLVELPAGLTVVL